jgi:sulfur carrier protein
VELTVNGEAQEHPDRATVADLLGDRTRGVAVARNDEVVPRSAWADTPLADGDRIEILEAHQGG